MNIVVAGYPKSGTTWVARLVADLLNCPLGGNWGFDPENDDIVEGADRESDHTCYKSHHLPNELNSVWNLDVHKIIYVIRDPRDVVISGSHFFNFYQGTGKFKKLDRLIKLLHGFTHKALKQNKMTDAIIYGDRSINPWLQNSWQEHVTNYEGFENVVIIKYEDLITNPIHTCKDILSYLEVTVGDESIHESIRNQSFESKLSDAKRKKHRSDLKLLRSGSVESWKSDLSHANKERIESVFQQTLIKYGYL